MLPSRPTVLLTGSTGVIGTSLLPALAARHHITALVRHRRPDAPVACVEGDLTAEDLGMSTSRRRELAAKIDVIVHCAGLTAMAPPDLTAFDTINAEGTRRILRLAEETGVPVLLLSSAAAAFQTPGEDLAARSMRAYSTSKRRAEELAAHCTQPVAIVRPALLFAARNATTPPRHQFPHALLTALLQDRAEGLPVNPDHWCDVLPIEMLTDYLTALTDALLRGDTTAAALHWVTAGQARLTAADMERACLDYLAETGRPTRPLLAPPGATHRRSHGMARIAQLGFQPPEQPALPSHLDRLLPSRLTREAALEALARNVRLCIP
ncbi:SDR family oxidoreductase [Streptomyces sp. I05A-00742]|uniref:SDR family oxidoreductase n=1 Tax=Streptomyces sp. I05A-00742 TaxID=2732853 RepID=UPI001488CE80|nr:SDR family oxidoreductase [Streptomyces sp. I05A-00742]